jgi:hypothetical protein
MTQTIRAHFDGKVIVPDEPVQLPVGQSLRVHLEVSAPPAPQDEWERKLLESTVDCGVSLPHSALSSEGLYE